MATILEFRYCKSFQDAFASIQNAIPHLPYIIRQVMNTIHIVMALTTIVLQTMGQQCDNDTNNNGTTL